MTVRTRDDAISHLGQARRSASGRLDFLDALRGVAVALVLAQHVGELLFPAVHEFTMVCGVQLGQMGVTVFFLCSGFIIPASLERRRAGESPAGRLAGFWRSRFFRLFPLYWVSLAGVLLLTVAGHYRPAQPMSPRDWLVDASMLQMFAGVPNALGLYWTLAFELLFYLGLSALFVVGWHRRSVALSLLAATASLAMAIGAPLVLHRAPVLGVFYLGTMVTGTVFHRWHAGSVRLRTLVLCVVAMLGSGAAVLAASYRGAAAQPAQDPRFVPMLTAWIGAYAVFCVGIALRRRSVPSWLRRLGTLSYSVYLMQALVLVAVPRVASPWATAALWVAATLVVSEATFRFVERPAMALGRRISASGGHRPATARPLTAAVDRPVEVGVLGSLEPVASGAPAA